MHACIQSAGRPAGDDSHAILLRCKTCMHHPSSQILFFTGLIAHGMSMHTPVNSFRPWLASAALRCAPTQSRTRPISVPIPPARYKRAFVRGLGLERSRERSRVGKRSRRVALRPRTEQSAEPSVGAHAQSHTESTSRDRCYREARVRERTADRHANRQASTDARCRTPYIDAIAMIHIHPYTRRAIYASFD